ncbi:juvenile hormone esterase-like [Periplaneta americana]|uniref:juvenile hormone esterase-like n=1 Tax=Periplaneta americana TaxID=6978 RepID=UPI0037E7F2F5
MKRLLIYISLQLLLVCRIRADCVVSIDQGTARGALLTSFAGKEFCSYSGIPYATPPVGDLRFRAPEPALPWTGELNATKPGNSCMQSLMSIYLGNEDCLYLNVHTPQVTESTSELLPVMVFIHGGGYTFGSGKPASYGPHFIIDKDVVMITINYRLGVFGFLSTGDDAAPGNFGLKDQLEALRWIQKNIAAFGGDPNKVTIFGESAGSFSVHFHVLSQASKGLFHAAIGESGSALMPMFLDTTHSSAVALKQGEAVGCPTDNTADLIDCLRKIDADTLMTNDPGMCPFEGLECYYYEEWRVVTETQSDLNPEPFLTAPPQDIIRSGNFNKVPFVLGTNSEEAGFFLVPYIGTKDVMDKLNLNFDRLGETAFFLWESESQDMIAATWQSVADFYIGTNHTITPDNYHKLIEAANDRFMQHNIQKSVELHLQAGHSTVYLYNFGYRGKYSLIAKARYGDLRFDLGVLHADEMQYILSYGSDPQKWTAGHPDLEVVDAVVTLWTNVAKYGHPTPSEGTIPQSIAWPAAGDNQDQVTYYVFGHQEPPVEPVDGIMPLRISVVPDLFKARMDFWDSLPLSENQQ